MYTLFYNNKSALVAQQRKLDIISNNISNVQTNGYKKIDAQFADLYQDSLNRKGYPVTEGVKDLTTGTGVRIGKATRETTQGTLKETGISTDLAIDGEGLFKVYMGDGKEAYTRAGSFKADAAGSLVDGNGNRVSIVDKNGREINNGRNLKLTNDNFIVDKSGLVSVKTPNGDIQEVGQIKVYDIIGNDSFASVGDNLFIPKEGTQVYESNKGTIYQGYLENSNVNMGEEMTGMILTQRAFQLSSAGLKTADEMWGMINTLR